MVVVLLVLFNSRLPLDLVPGVEGAVRIEDPEVGKLMLLLALDVSKSCDVGKALIELLLIDEVAELDIEIVPGGTDLLTEVLPPKNLRLVEGCGWPAGGVVGVRVGVAVSLVRRDEERLDCESSDVPPDHPPSARHNFKGAVPEQSGHGEWGEANKFRHVLT